MCEGAYSNMPHRKTGSFIKQLVITGGSHFLWLESFLTCYENLASRQSSGKGNRGKGVSPLATCQLHICSTVPQLRSASAAPKYTSISASSWADWATDCARIRSSAITIPPAFKARAARWNRFLFVDSQKVVQQVRDQDNIGRAGSQIHIPNIANFKGDRCPGSPLFCAC